MIPVMAGCVKFITVIVLFGRIFCFVGYMDELRLCMGTLNKQGRYLTWHYYLQKQLLRYNCEVYVF